MCAQGRCCFVPDLNSGLRRIDYSREGLKWTRDDVEWDVACSSPGLPHMALSFAKNGRKPLRFLVSQVECGEKALPEVWFESREGDPTVGRFVKPVVQHLTTQETVRSC